MQTAEPLISVCTPIYNTEKYLEECLESLFNAKMADQCEFIFVNDCATDSSPQILERVSEKYKNLNIRIIKQGKNLGVAAARNTGLKAATGKYIAHFDSDDSISADFFEKMYRTAEENNADMVVCNNWRSFDENLSSVELVNMLLRHEMLPTLWCKLAKRSLFTENGITWREGINVGEDPIISMKLTYFSKKTVFLQDMLYNYRSYIGFVTRLKKTVALKQKELEFSEIATFAEEHGFSDLVADVISFRRAEIKYDYLKAANPLSFSKFSFMKDQKLSILLENRADFNKKSTRLLISFVDRRKMIPANFMYILYRIISITKGKQNGK